MATFIIISFAVFICILCVLLFVVWTQKGNLEESHSQLKQSYAKYKKKTQHLRQYEQIDDAKEEADRIVTEAQQKLDSVEHDYNLTIDQAKQIAAREIKEAHNLAEKELEETRTLASQELKDARAKAKEVREKAESQLADAVEIGAKIETEANHKAEQIAGNAWDARTYAKQYAATAKAMKNVIKGYGDEYLIPNETVIDDLALEYDHTNAGRKLALVKTQIASMIKNNQAADCDYVDPNRKTTAIEFVLDAYIGKVETIMSKVKHDNYGKLLQRLEDAYRIVNYNGKAFKDARILETYHDLMIQQLKLAVAVSEIKKKDQEEQRRIKAEMREEEKARKDYQKAIKEAEKEERLLQKALKEAEEQLSAAAAEEKALLEEKLLELQQQLEEAEQRGERAMSMAQQTKQGHVYVISNIGSFGENVFKIGLTRRLEPQDRVKELSGASVPFNFDVHAMIHSVDAPQLEKELHEMFSDCQVNKVNPRKEFFRVQLSEIREKVKELELSSETHWTMKAEAIEYRETLAMSTQDDELPEPLYVEE